MTPDRGYIVDQHPFMSNVFVGAGFSGKSNLSVKIAGGSLTPLTMYKLVHDVY